MALNALYTASCTSNGGRNGVVKSSDGVLELKLSMPKALGGPGGHATNPEQLFAAAYSACFESAVRLAAQQQEVKLTEVHVTASVSIGQASDRGFGLKVELDVNLPGLDPMVAEDVVRTAHLVCPYSKAVHNNIEVTLNTRVM